MRQTGGDRLRETQVGLLETEKERKERKYYEKVRRRKEIRSSK